MNENKEETKPCPLSEGQSSLLHLLTALAVVCSSLSGKMILFQVSLAMMVALKAFVWYYNEKMIDFVFLMVFFVGLVTLLFMPISNF